MKINIDKNIIVELKKSILESRYKAARTVNKELVKLYFEIGKKISLNTKMHNWGSKVLENISQELQNELPGLKGFSAGNLKKMKIFAEFWIAYLTKSLEDNQSYIKNSEIGSALSNELKSEQNQIGSALPNELQLINNQLNSENIESLDKFLKAFFKTSFTHYYLIVSKSETIDEAKFRNS